MVNAQSCAAGTYQVHMSQPANTAHKQPQLQQIDVALMLWLSNLPGFSAQVLGDCILFAHIDFRRFLQ